jgi:hypothetical protein
MPDTHTLRIHVEYSVLFTADLRKIVGTIESAYNILQKAEQQDKRMHRADRLTVQTIKTGNSVTLIALGGLGLMAFERLFAARKSFWESEKTKWEAKNARRDYEERIERADATKLTETETVLDGENLKAARLVLKLVKFVDKSKEITSLQIEIDGKDPEPNKPDEPLPLEGGGRKLKVVL